MIEDKFIDLYAVNSRIPAGIARQEIVLTYALALLNDARILKQLGFKGGTCLRKIHFGKGYRFSEDLDFTALAAASPVPLLRDLVKAFSKPFYDIAFQQISGSERITPGGIGVQFEYNTPSATGAFDLEVSFRAEPILPVVDRQLQNQSYFKQLEFRPPAVQSLAIEEIFSEKIRATFQRTRPRDVYDLHFCFQRPLRLMQVKGLVLLKCWQVRDPFNLDRFLENLHSTKFNWEELENLLPKRSRPSPQEMIRTIESRIGMFHVLSEDERKIVSDSRRHRELKLVNSYTTRVRDFKS